MNDTHKLFDLKDPHELMKDLADHLSWNSGENVLFEAARVHRMWQLARLRIWETASGAKVYQRVKSLPLAAQQRLLMAPQFFYLLQQTATPDEQNLAAIMNYIQIEELLVRGTGNVEQECWSAFGDVYLAPGVGSTFRKSYEAPRMDNLIFDVRSPYYGALTSEWGQFAEYSDAESLAFQQNIVNAFTLIRSTSTPALSTIESSLRVILGLKTIANPHLRNAASARSAIGVMFVTNPHSDTWKPEKLADSLVHEAIHSLIYKLELAIPLYTDYPATLSVKTTSTWSGATLTLRSLVHACFVWYGLWRFWGLVDKSIASTYYSRARKGFLERSPLDQLSKADRDLIQPYVCSAIEGFYRAVNQEADVKATEMRESVPSAGFADIA